MITFWGIYAWWDNREPLRPDEFYPEDTFICYFYFLFFFKPILSYYYFPNKQINSYDKI